MRGLIGTLAFLFSMSLVSPTSSMANSVTYNIDRTIGPGTVKGTITTDGALGILSKDNIIDYKLTIQIRSTSLTISPSSGKSPAVSIKGAALRATPSGIVFDAAQPSSSVRFGETGCVFWTLTTYVDSSNPRPYESVNVSSNCQATPSTAVLSGQVMVAGSPSPSPQPSPDPGPNPTTLARVWTNVTSSRQQNNVYRNVLSYEIDLYIRIAPNGGPDDAAATTVLEISQDGSRWSDVGSASVSTRFLQQRGALHTVIPPGYYYRFRKDGGTGNPPTIVIWQELH